MDAAAGITRGWAPKPYGYVDPNEDVVAVVAGPRATLVVLADGHNGKESSLTAVQTVVEAFGEDPPAANFNERQLLQILDDANIAVQRGSLSLRPPNRDSATTLVVALIAPGCVQWAAIGDSIATVAAPSGHRMLFSPTRRYLGHPTYGSLAMLVSRGKAKVPAGAWIIVATDGYSDWAPVQGDLARATGQWVAGAANAAGVVEVLMEKAKLGGAGDNVAIAVARR